MPESQNNYTAQHHGREDGDPAAAILTRACGVDVVGPLPTSHAGCCYLLTVIDRSTRWCKAVPLEDITAEAILEAFISGWVARFGVPKRITSDRGAQFTSGTWTEWCRQLQVEHIKTTAFHP